MSKSKSKPPDDGAELNTAMIREAAYLEAASSVDGDSGIIRDAVLITAGTSKNRNRYAEAVLARDYGVLEGLPARSGHYRTDDMTGRSDPRNLAGVWENVRYEGGAIRGDIRLFEAYLPIAKTARDAGNLIGVSIDVMGKHKVTREGDGKIYRDVEALVAHGSNSVDIVVHPAAGGRLYEAATDEWWLEQETQDQETPIMSDEQKVAENTQQPDEKPQPTQEVSQPTKLAEAESAVNEAQRLIEAAKIERCEATLERRLSEAKLPEKAEGLLKKRFSGRIFEAAELESEIREFKEALDDASGSGQVTGLGATIKVGPEAMDKQKSAVYGFFTGANEDGVERYKTFREAYAKFTGDAFQSPFQILRETQVKDYDSERMVETNLLSTTWAEVFADAMHKRLVQEFQQPNNDEWRRIVSNIETITDFRTNHRTWYGGFGVLDSVPENGVYQFFDTPTDDDETYSISKKGNLFDLTLEAIANDDSGAIRALPVKMARTAKNTLNRDVFTILTANGNLGDGVALFHTNSTLRGGDGATAASGNLGSTALSAAALTLRRVNMIQRAARGDSTNVLGIEPKIIVVPPELDDTAWELATNQWKVTTNQDSTLKNPHTRQNYEVVTVPFWTDATDWYLLSNPQTGPTLEVGFFNGRQQPDIYSREEFTTDKVTYKCRFIYGVGVLSWIGLDRSTVAN